MTDCVNAEMRDALPDLIHGRLESSRAAEVQAHAASCAECSAELELLRNIFASAPSAPSMNIGRIASAIPSARLVSFALNQGGEQGGASVARRSGRGWVKPLFRIAAAIAIVSVGAFAINMGKRVTRPASVAATVPSAEPTLPSRSSEVVPEPASSGSVQELRPATKSAPRVADEGLSLVGDVDDLSDDRLATLIGEMDRMDAIPSAEPEAISPVVGDVNDRGTNQ